MPNLDLEKYKKQLLKERDAAHVEMEILERAISYGDTGEGQSELADYDNHPADAGTETFEKEKDLAVRDSYHDIIGKIDEALAKMERGTYGTCDRCGREIQKARLDAIPHAIFCVDCQDIIEGR